MKIKPRSSKKITLYDNFRKLLLLFYLLESQKDYKQATKFLSEKLKLEVLSKTGEKRIIFIIKKINWLLIRGLDELVIENLENKKFPEHQESINKSLLLTYISKLTKLTKNRPVFLDYYYLINKKIEKIINSLKEKENISPHLKLSLAMSQAFAELLERNKNITEECVTLIENVRYLESEHKLMELIYKESNNSVAISELGFVKAHLGKIDEGIKLLKKSIELNKDDYVNYNHLAIVYIMKNKYHLAIENIKKSFLIRPNFKILLKYFVYTRKDIYFEKIRDLKEFKDLFE